MNTLSLRRFALALHCTVEEHHTKGVRWLLRLLLLRLLQGLLQLMAHGAASALTRSGSHAPGCLHTGTVNMAWHIALPLSGHGASGIVVAVAVVVVKP
jgi:hypothetical protein